MDIRPYCRHIHLLGLTLVRYTLEAQRTIDAAKSLSAAMGHSYVGADHLAISLLRSRDTEAVCALKRLRVPVAELRRALSAALPPRQAPGADDRPMSPRLNQLFRRASALAGARDSGPIGTEDLLLALVQADGSTREQVVSAIIAATNGSAYSCCVAADILRTVGDIFRDRETYPRAKA